MAAPASPSSGGQPLSSRTAMRRSPATQALWDLRPAIIRRLHPADDQHSPDGPPRGEGEPPPRTPSQSNTSIVYPFSSDRHLREQFRDPSNRVGIGKLLEELDALAAVVAFKHCCNNDGTAGHLQIVTVSLDKMVLKKAPRVDTDMKIAGSVAWVGRSSLKIRTEVTQFSEEDGEQPDYVVSTAIFTFVARDAKTGRPAVNRLEPQTEAERKLLKEGEMRDKLSKEKKEDQKKELVKVGHVFHGEVERFKVPALADADGILVRDTCLENSLVCQPQQRNVSGRIFGGFLMRRAFELAYSTAYAFSGRLPCLLEVDRVGFLRPVDVGDFLRFKSRVLYTQLENPVRPLINIEVVAHVTRPELRRSEVSNTFCFTFTVHPDSLKNGRNIRNVVPATEEEARPVLERIDAKKEDSYLVPCGQLRSRI